MPKTKSSTHKCSCFCLVIRSKQTNAKKENAQQTTTTKLKRNFTMNKLHINRQCFWKIFNGFTLVFCKHAHHPNDCLCVVAHILIFAGLTRQYANARTTKTNLVKFLRIFFWFRLIVCLLLLLCASQQCEKENLGQRYQRINRANTMHCITTPSIHYDFSGISLALLCNAMNNKRNCGLSFCFTSLIFLVIFSLSLDHLVRSISALGVYFHLKIQTNERAKALSVSCNKKQIQKSIQNEIVYVNESSSNVELFDSFDWRAKNGAFCFGLYEIFCLV